MSDEEWSRVERYLPRSRRGAHRVGDRRVISGIIHMLKIGARWRDCPADYGPYTTIYSRFNRSSKQAVWEDVFYALSGSSSVISTTAVDSTHVKAHRSAAGAKGGLRTGHRPNSRRTDDQSSCHNRRPWPALGLHRDTGPTHDLIGVAALLRRVPIPRQLIADRPMMPASSGTGSPNGLRSRYPAPSNAHASERL